MDRRYFADLGNERERIAVRRWMFTRIGDLTNALGLRGGWWLGLFLERSDLFGDDADGDVDFIGGRIEYDFTEEEWADRVWFERRTQPAAPSLPEWYEQQAHIRAAREGRLQWPPSLRFTVGGEFKASHYTDRWKATHVAEGNRVLGQLRYVRDAGVNRVAFVHLAATSPVAGMGADPSRTPAELSRTAVEAPAVILAHPIPLAVPKPQAPRAGTRVCVTCGRSFLARRPEARACSGRCRMHASRERRVAELVGRIVAAESQIVAAEQGLALARAALAGLRELADLGPSKVMP